MDVTNQKQGLLDTSIVMSRLGQLEKSTPNYKILTMRHQGKSYLQKLAKQYKEQEMKRDNNSPENHKRGLEKRIANYATQHTIRTMPNSPAKVHLAVKRAFYGNVIKMLKLA